MTCDAASGTLHAVADGWALFFIAGWLGVLGALAVALFLRSLRGRLTPIAPACARCRHPLPLASLAAQSGSASLGTCQECGADLAGESAVLFFRRGVAVPRLVASIILVVIAVAPLVLTRSLRGTGPRSVTVSTRMVAAGDAASSVEAIQQAIASARGGDALDCTALLDRAQRGDIDDEALRTIVQAMVTSRERRSTQLTHASEHEVVRLAISKELLTPAQVRLYVDGFPNERSANLRQALLDRLPPGLRDGTPLSITGVATAPTDWLLRTVRLLAIEVDGTTIAIRPQGDPTSSGLDPGQFGAVDLARPPGTYTVTLVAEESITLLPTRPTGGVASSVETPTSAVVEHRVESPLTIIGRDDPSWIPTTIDPEFAEEVRRVCHVRQVAIDLDASTTRCSLLVDVDTESSSHVSLAFELFVVIDGAEHRVGQRVSAVVRQGAQTLVVAGPTRDGPVAIDCPPWIDTGGAPATVDVVFRPNPRLCEPFGRPEPVWGGEIRITNVPLRTSAIGGPR